MSKSPRVSVIMPTYNHLTFLPRAVETALDQTYEDFELIIVNDGSTDGTKEWLDDLHHAKVRVIHQENAGPAEAINTGMKAALGEFVCWISADNESAPFYLEAHVAALDETPEAAMSFSPYYLIDQDSKTVAMHYDNQMKVRGLVTNNNPGNAGFLYRKSVHDTVGLYEGWACDTLMWYRIAKNFPLVHVVEPTYYYRVHDERATIKNRDDVNADIPGITEEFLKDLNGTFNVQTVRMLYPGTEQFPQESFPALADFALRMSTAGLHGIALDILVLALGSCPADKAPRILNNLVTISLLAGQDPADRFVAGINRNQSLTDAQKGSLKTLFVALVHVAEHSNQRIEAIGHEEQRNFRRAEMPKLFSFMDWKYGQRRGSTKMH